MNIINIAILIAFIISLYGVLRLGMMFTNLSYIGYRKLALWLIILGFSSCQLFGWFDVIQFVQSYIKK